MESQSSNTTITINTVDGVVDSFYAVPLLASDQCLACRLPGLLCKEGIHHDQRCHRLDDWYGSGHDARVVPTLGFQQSFLEIIGCGGLRLADGCRRLESDPEEDIRPVGDAALDAAGVVGFGD